MSGRFAPDPTDVLYLDCVSGLIKYLVYTEEDEKTQEVAVSRAAGC